MSSPVSGAFSGATVVLIKAVPGEVFGYFLSNDANASTTSWVQFFDAPAIAQVTLGTTVPVFAIPIPGGAAANLSFGINGSDFKSGICIAQATTRTGATSPSSACSFTIWI